MHFRSIAMAFQGITVGFREFQGVLEGPVSFKGNFEDLRGYLKHLIV